jgi:hypothetical protein
LRLLGKDKTNILGLKFGEAHRHVTAFEKEKLVFFVSGAAVSLPYPNNSIGLL